MAEARPQLVEVENNDSSLTREAPHNIEVEQALLGAILLNNEALHHTADGLLDTHFYQPLHQKIFRTIIQLNEKGQIANPKTLKHIFASDDGNNGDYLGQLAGAAVSIINTREYSQLILDLAKKRELISIGTEVVNEAFDTADERTDCRDRKGLWRETLHGHLVALDRGGDAGCLARRVHQDPHGGVAEQTTEVDRRKEDESAGRIQRECHR